MYLKKDSTRTLLFFSKYYEYAGVENNISIYDNELMECTFS